MNNPFKKKKKKLENSLTLEEMTENFNLFTYEREALRSEQIKEALDLCRKRRVSDYVR